jgi:hypothetical protein
MFSLKISFKKLGIFPPFRKILEMTKDKSEQIYVERKAERRCEEEPSCKC